MRRYLYDNIRRDLRRKMVFLTGPRQIGKTYLARELMAEFARPVYLNYDARDDARILANQSWPGNADFLILDEIHKMPDWKRYLKGLYDTRPDGQAILVTGSARMETWRQSGESLAGRYLAYRLFPVTVREAPEGRPEENLARLNLRGGFPEPFLAENDDDAQRWRNQYFTDIIREDILDFGRIHEIRTMRLLLELLRERVGSPLSYAALAEDLQLAPNTVRRYMDILESLYIVFLVRPFSRNIARALLKAPKVYFFDAGFVKGDDGVRLENTCAVSLLKHCAFLQDTTGANVSLRYLKTKEGREVDFVVCRDDAPTTLIEVKRADRDPAPGLRYAKGLLPEAEAVQIVQDLRQEEDIKGVAVRAAARWLANLSA